MFGAYSGFRRGALGGENASQAKECPGLRIQGHTEFAGSRARVEVVCVCVSRAAWEALLEAVTAEETPLLVVMDLDRSRL